MEFTLKRDLPGATPIRNGKLQNLEVKVLRAGTSGIIHGNAYDCPDSNPPQECINLLVGGTIYEVSKRVFDTAI
jgi:hypothetical protein